MSEPKANYQLKKTESTSVISLEKGKIPPQAVDLEEVVIGSMLVDSYGVTEAISIIRKQPIFYKEAHQHVYDAVLDLFEASQSIDLLTVSEKLKQKGKLDSVGGDFFLIGLTQRVSSSAHIETHCRVLMQFYVKRSAIQVANRIIEKSYEDQTDIFDLLEDSQRDIDDVAQWLLVKPASDFKAVSDQIFSETHEKKVGIPSKLTKLQEQFNGYQDPDMIILAARPGMGKTAFFLNEAKHQAMMGIPVGIFSLEMSAKQLGERMLAEFCNIDSTKIKNKTTSPEERNLMQSKRSEFEKLPIYINDQGGLTPMQFKLEAGKMKREKGVKMIYIDYLQLMKDGGKVSSGNREQEISYISSSIKATAKNLEIPIMALAQLSRAVENRGGMKRPILSDLRESGSLEQDSDIVIFMLRPEYYKITEWDDDQRSPTHGQCELTIAKYRGGELFSTVVKTDLKYMRFSDLEEPWEPLSTISPVSAAEAFDSPFEHKETMPSDFNNDDDMPF